MRSRSDFLWPWWKSLLLIAFFWAGVNLATVVSINWFERASLETRHNLRPGILNEFSAKELEIPLPDNSAITVGYRVYEPHSNSQAVTFPVVIYLHGAGERGYDNARQLSAVPTVLTGTTHRQSHPCFVLVPQCPPGVSWSGFRDRYSVGGDQDTDPILRMLNCVLEDPRADADRIYVMGFSMGSFGTWKIAADYPAIFAAAVPISGGVSEPDVEALIDLPIWTVHGNCDNSCSVEDTRAGVVALEEAGGLVRYTEFDGIGHSWKPAFKTNEILDWVFAQNKSRSK